MDALMWLLSHPVLSLVIDAAFVLVAVLVARRLKEAS